MFRTITEIKRANKAAGNTFFDRSHMRFWRSRIESPVYGGKYFVTSEQTDDERVYTVRRANDDGEIETMGHFGMWPDRTIARRWARMCAKEDHLATA